MDASKFSSGDLAEKAEELVSIVSAYERQLPDMKAALDSAATAAELATMRPEGDHAERALSQARAAYQQHVQELDEQRAALKGVRALLGERQAAETHNARAEHARAALELLERRAGLIDDLKAALAKAEEAAVALVEGDRTIDGHLMRSNKRELGKSLDPTRLRMQVKSLVLMTAPMLAHYTELTVIANKQIARRLDLSERGTLYNPVHLDALRSAAEPVA
jgi:hypothetical protein